MKGLGRDAADRGALAYLLRRFYIVRYLRVHHAGYWRNAGRGVSNQQQFNVGEQE